MLKHINKLINNRHSTKWFYWYITGTLHTLHLLVHYWYITSIIWEKSNSYLKQTLPKNRKYKEHSKLLIPKTKNGYYYKWMDNYRLNSLENREAKILYKRLSMKQYFSSCPVEFFHALLMNEHKSDHFN